MSPKGTFRKGILADFSKRQILKDMPYGFYNVFPEGNVIKYVCRHKYKGGKEDLEKAKHFIDMIIERDYK